VVKKRLAIVGNGMAAGKLLDDLTRRDALAGLDVSVYGEEPHGCYNRILLGRVLTGGEPDEITLKPRAWYSDRGVHFHSGVQVKHLDTVGRKVVTAGGDAHPYDVAVFATGSKPFVPPISGVDMPPAPVLPGVFVFRTVDDCLTIRRFARPLSSAVVVGGGLLGLEAAKALCDLGLHVTVVHLAPHLMNAQLDSAGGAMLRKAIERMGIFVRTGVSVAAVQGGDRVETVRLTDGEVMPADLVVLACGIVPRTEAAQASGVPVGRGILVNDVLATQVPGVYAVGECAEHAGKVYGLVQPIWDQCTVLADVLTGANPKSRYRGSKVYARLKVMGVEVAAMGVTEPESDADEVVQVVEDRRGVYRKLVVRDGKLIGAMLVGDTDAAPGLIQLFDRGDLLPTNRLDVLATPTGCGVAAAADPEVCNCHHVRESTLVEAIRGGCTSLATLSDATRAGTGCGSCRGQLAGLILSHSKAETTA
jgi:nitrite reductase (NADH) large subunit